MLQRINWVLMLATLASAFALYVIKYDARRLETRVQAQERALEKAQSDIALLAAERAHLARPERLEPLARLNGLAPIAGRQYVRIDAGSPIGSSSDAAAPALDGR
jgi:cell division protein FtsL